ncbi:hypothetical protein PUN28_003751 [Cardiocondyla obscurior]|uniref:Uncharacterized protein n=1 Tax=Cardiocondyla obscurior TaxID=286306 RepID=A0AAW2GP85_9HYME
MVPATERFSAISHPRRPRTIILLLPPTDQLEATNLSEQSTKPGSEQFRPTTPSYIFSSSFICNSRFPGGEFRACFSPLFPPPFPFVLEKDESLGEDDSISLPELDFQNASNLPDPSIELLEDHEKSSEIEDPLLKLLRKTIAPWSDPVLEKAIIIGFDHFDPKKTRRQVSRSPLKSNFFVFYPGVETPFLAPMSLINLIFPRTTVRVCEIEEITLD